MSVIVAPSRSEGSVRPVPLSRRILLVDPDVDSRAIYRTLLQHYGHHVLEASHGREALERAFSARPHAALTSVYHGGLSGVQLIRTLKHDPRTEDVRVVALTADAREETRERVLRAGGDLYLLKPSSPHLLLCALDAEPA